MTVLLGVVYVLIFVPVYCRGLISKEDTESALRYLDLTRFELIDAN